MVHGLGDTEIPGTPRGMMSEHSSSSTDADFWRNFGLFSISFLLVAAGSI